MMNDARAVVAASSDKGAYLGGDALPTANSTTRQERKSTNTKYKKKSTAAHSAIIEPASVSLKAKVSTIMPSETPSSAISKPKSRNKRAKSTVSQVGQQVPKRPPKEEFIDFQVIPAQSASKSKDVKGFSPEPSNVSPALSKKRDPKKKKPAAVIVTAFMTDPSTAQLQTARNNTLKKKKEKENWTAAATSKILSVMNPSATKEPKRAILQASSGPPGVAGHSHIAKNLAHVVKTQQNIMNLHRSRKNFTKETIFPFLNLPRELRDIIISYTLDYNGISPEISKINNTFPSKSLRKCNFPDIYQEWMSDLERQSIRTTPTVLLLNHQIHEEAQEMLRKKTMCIVSPPQYPCSGQFVLSRFINDDALEKVRKVKFELHTYPAKVRKPNILHDDWRGKDLLKDERLADSYPWAMLLKDCFELWRRNEQSRSLEISIDHCSGGRSEYNLSVSGKKVWKFEKCIDEMLLSHDFDALVAFLTFAHVPIEFEQAGVCRQNI